MKNLDKNSLYKLATPYLKYWQIEGKEIFYTPSSILVITEYKNTKAIIKIPFENSDETHSKQILELFPEDLRPKILDSYHNATLLERITPGTTIESLAKKDDNQATLIICNLIKRIAEITPRKSDKVRNIYKLSSGFDKYLNSSDKNIVMTAQNIFKKLEQEAGPLKLLHGDLHHENILKNSKDDYIIIDPKGYLGEIEFEFAAMLRNPIKLPNLWLNEDQLKQRLEIIKQEFPQLNQDKIISYGFAVNILSATWMIEDNVFNFEIPYKTALTIAKIGFIKTIRKVGI